MKTDKILLVVDDPAVRQSIKEALGNGYEFLLAADLVQARSFLAEALPQLIIIDFDLKGEDGLSVFKKLGAKAKTIMLSASNSVPLAVTATKAGVVDFLRKPINAEEFKTVVSQNLSVSSRQLSFERLPLWLSGKSSTLTSLFLQIKIALASSKEIVLVGGLGIPLDSLAGFIHQNSEQKETSLTVIDVADFQEEGQEALFWTTLQESFKGREGAVYLSNIEVAGEHFKRSLLDFVKQKSGSASKNGLIMLGIGNKEALIGINLSAFAVINVPKLLERQADLPCLITAYLEECNRVYGKSINAISLSALNLLMEYGFPGNYLELAAVVKQAALLAQGGQVELRHLSLSSEAFSQIAVERSLGQNSSLIEATVGFESKLYAFLKAKFDGDISQVASFLGIARAALVDRLESLAD